MRILLIDDEPLVLSGIRRVVASQGYEIVVAATATDALRLLAEDAGFDVILSDLMLPDLEGPELYAQAVARDPELEPRFLFMTGGALTARARAFVESFRARCVEKPFDARTVSERVRTFAASLSTRRLRRVTV